MATRSSSTLVRFENFSKRPLDVEAKPLLFGDLIYINLADVKRGQPAMMMYSRGYIDKTVLFNKEKSVRKDIQGKLIQINAYVIDLSNCCFQVLPAIDYITETAIRREINMMDLNSDNAKSLNLINNLDSAFN